MLLYVLAQGRHLAVLPRFLLRRLIRDEIEQSLADGETMAGLVESAVRAEIVRRREHSEFVRRGLDAIARTKHAGDGIPADVVIARLEARVAAARKTRRA